MNKIRKIIIAVLPLAFWAFTLSAQNASGDLMHALNYSKKAAETSDSEEAAYNAARSFYDAEESGKNKWNNYKKKLNHQSQTNSSQQRTGATITRGSSERNRAKTDMSKVGVHNTSGYNKGAMLADYYATQRAERARREAERRERMVYDYMVKHRAFSGTQEEAWQVFINNNANAKPFSEEEIRDLISNGLPGNVVIDDNGVANFQPDKLLEGSDETHETLEDRLRKMSDEEIKMFAEDLEERCLNDEQLTDEELDFLDAWEASEIERLKKEVETKKQINDHLDSIF